MLRRAHSYIYVIIAAVLFQACSRVPHNARYIPADATAIAGINLGSLSKKIAWNLITGSKLYKEMQQRMTAEGSGEAMKGIENAGIDVSNTFYIYTRSDTRFSGGNLMVALVPLSDAARWEAYIKQVFPRQQAVRRQGYKEAALGAGMYVGWTDGLLIIINASAGAAEDGEDNEAGQRALIASEMARAFQVPAGNSIVNNKRFSQFAKQGHDLCFWLNYGSLLTNLAAGAALEINGISLSSAAWSDAVITAVLDFRKGKIAGDISYYLPAQVEAATQGFGRVKTNEDLLDRLPKEDLDILLSMHISPGGVKTLLEKAGLFGPANMGLTTQGLDMDYVLEAFTGDMAIAMHNFSLQAEDVRDSLMGELVTHKKQKASMTMTYAVKINNHEHFFRIMEMTAARQMQRTGSGYTLPLTADDSVHLHMDKHYAVMSNNKAFSTGIIDGRFAKTNMPSRLAENAYGSPFAIFIDIKQMLAKVDAGITSSPRDSAIIAESKKLLDNVALYGGNYTDNAYKFSLEINFTNRDENSVLELIDFGMRMSDLRNMTVQ